MRQLVSLVLERVVAEDEQYTGQDLPPQSVNFEELKVPRNTAPKGMGPCAGDAYLMFQVILLPVFFCYFSVKNCKSISNIFISKLY